MAEELDYNTLKEIKAMKNERNVIDEELEAQKYAFQHSLMAGMGERMMKELKDPSKPSKKVGRAYRKALKQTIKDNKKMADKQKKGGF